MDNNSNIFVDVWNIEKTAIDASQAFDFVSDDAHGAADLFLGSVRNHNLGKPVKGVSYDVYEELAINNFKEICNEAIEKWGPRMKIYVVHGKGRLDIGGISIVIAVSSPHRKESFDACRYVIEEIKHRSPVWKKEHYIDGDSEWVQGHALCQHG